MDEKALIPQEPTPENRGKGSKKGGPTTVACRFNGFAVCHILLSLLTVGILPALLAIGDLPPWAAGLCGCGLMAAYFPAGCLASFTEGWSGPKSEKEKVQAVLFPALVAWAWVGVVFLALFLEEQALFYVVFMLSVFLAAPSSFFSILAMIFLSGPYGAGWGGLLVGGLLSGFLPPLLFAVGSFWQSARMEGKDLLAGDGGTAPLL